MGQRLEEDARGTDINPYRRDAEPRPQIGTHAACELCEEDRLVFTRYGLVACRYCHRDLLPGEGVP
jgi:hypothetical protein